MVAYMERMPAGIAGAISRTSGVTLEPGLVGPNPIPFGAFVKIKNGLFEAIGNGDTAASVVGLLTRSFPVQSAVDGFGAAQASPGSQQDLMRRGYMAVALKAGTAAKRGQVHVRVVAGSGRVPGDIEATADAANTIAVPGCYFTGPADAGGITEIEFNL